MQLWFLKNATLVFFSWRLSNANRNCAHIITFRCRIVSLSFWFICVNLFGAQACDALASSQIFIFIDINFCFLKALRHCNPELRSIVELLLILIRKWQRSVDFFLGFAGQRFLVRQRIRIQQTSEWQPLLAEDYSTLVSSACDWDDDCSTPRVCRLPPQQTRCEHTTEFAITDHFSVLESGTIVLVTKWNSQSSPKRITQCLEPCKIEEFSQ